MKKHIKKISYSIVTGILLIVIMFAITNTSFFRNWLISTLIEKLNSKINGTVCVERVDGNLWSAVTLRGISITHASDTLAHIPLFKIAYRPWRIVFQEIVLDSLIISGITVNMHRDEQEKWNVFNVFREAENADTTDVVSENSFPFSVTGNNITIQDMIIRFKTPDIGFPERIDHLNVSAGLYYSELYQFVHLDNLSFESKGPDFTLDTLSFNFENRDNRLSLKDFKLKSRANQMQGNMRHRNNDSELTLQSEAVQFSEFAFLLPSIDIKATPTVTLNTKWMHDSLIIDMRCAIKDQSFVIGALLENYHALLNDGLEAAYTYQLTIQSNRLNPQMWLEGFPYFMDISGSFKAAGSGNPFTAGRLNAEIEAVDSHINHSRLDSLSIHLFKQEYVTQSYGYASGTFGYGRFDLRVDSETEEQRFKLQAAFKKMNLEKIFDKATFNSELNFSLIADGSAKRWADYSTDLRLRCQPSRFDKIRIDSLCMDVHFSEDLFSLPSFTCKSALGLLDVQGEGDFKRNNHVNFAFNLEDLALIKSYFNLDTLVSEGMITGDISGGVDSLSAEVALALKKVHLNSYHTDELTGTSWFTYHDSRLTGTGDLSLLKVESGGVQLNSLDAKGRITPGFIDVHIRGNQSDSIDFALQAKYVFQNTEHLAISDMEIHLPGTILQSVSDTMRVVIADNSFYFEDCRLQSHTNTSDIISSIALEGFLSPDSTQDFKCQLVNLDLGYVSRVFAIPFTVDGLASAAIELKGTAETPELEARINISETVIDRFFIEDLEAAIYYKDKKISASTTLNFNATNQLFCEAQIPVDLSYAKLSEPFKPGSGSKIHCNTRGILLSILDYTGIDGTFTCDYTVNDLFATPEFSGTIQLKDGIVRLPEYGLDYEKINMRLNAEVNHITIEEMQIVTGRGKVDVNGFLVFAKMFPFKVSEVAFNIEAKEFIPIQNKDIELIVNGSPWVRIHDGLPEFGGRLDVSRLVLNVPALTGTNQVKKEMNLPLLVSLLPNQPDSLMETNREDIPELKRLADTLVADMQGSLKIYIPRNFWLVSPGMRIELYGDLDLAKTGSQFELFGEIRTLRGHYDLLARRFTVQENSSINFQGGEKVDPVLNINAVYTFRTVDREKKSLNLFITDKLSQLKFNYKLDDKEIDETDAFSYLLFGQSMSSSSGGQQSIVSDQANIFAMNIASQMFSQRLAKSVGDPLALDYIEVKAQDNWRSASFVVGKYLTNDFYLSYQRNFGETGDNDTVPEIITMEYELTRRLFFQLMTGSAKVSGLDLIYKFEK